MDRYYKRVNPDGSIQSLEGGPGIPPDTDGMVEITEQEFTALFAQIQTRAAEIRRYRDQIVMGQAGLESVPEELREAVLEALPPNTAVYTNPYGVSDETYHAIVDDYTLALMDAGVIG